MGPDLIQTYLLPRFDESPFYPSVLEQNSIPPNQFHPGDICNVEREETEKCLPPAPPRALLPASTCFFKYLSSLTEQNHPIIPATFLQPSGGESFRLKEARAITQPFKYYLFNASALDNSFNIIWHPWYSNKTLKSTLTNYNIQLQKSSCCAEFFTVSRPFCFVGFREQRFPIKFCHGKLPNSLKFWRNPQPRQLLFFKYCSQVCVSR